ncbi:MAG TPA: hypothetical protein VEX35_11315 [Allosphingosinicella sp.]|nr:hypothetical protein [Allosphingosinicella sp.]
MTASFPAAMGARMHPALPSCLLAVAAFAPLPAHAQSAAPEEVQGNQRLCNYAGNHGILSGRLDGRQYRVGIGENCAITHPLVNSGRPAPPTATLRADDPSPEGRICVYEQWGSRWTFNLRGRTACPATVGMIAGSPGSSVPPGTPARGQ